jgi:hypothetical protein
MVYIVGEVISLGEGFVGFGGLWGAFAFHAVSMGLGTALLARAAAARRPA